MIVTTSGKACRCRRYFSDPADVRAVAQLAEAERAEARRRLSPTQAEGLAAAHEMRRAEDRVAQWRRGNGELRVETPQAAAISRFGGRLGSGRWRGGPVSPDRSRLLAQCW